MGVEIERRPAEAERMNILLVDDQIDGLLALEAILEPLEQNLVRASSGLDALRLLLRQDFAIILLDVMMPGMDGFETAQLIRERERTRYTPIIFLTAARKGEGPLNRGYETGAVDFIYKPIDPEVLRSKVRVFVDLARKTELVRKQEQALREAQAREHAQALRETRERADAERLRREMEARTSQQRWLQALLSALPRPLLLSDPQTGEITFANAAADVLVRALREPGNALADAGSPLQRALRGESVEELQLDWSHDGTDGSMLLTSCRLPALHGRGEAQIVSVLDVTPLRRAEARLQRAVRARDEFMSAASHELNTPLTTIVLQLDSLARQVRKSTLAGDAKSERTLATLSRNVDRLGRLVAEMLDVSRIAEGRLRMELGECDLSEIVREVAGRYEEQFARVGCALELDVGGPVTGVWDRSRLDQVVTNLLTNALKYAPGKPVHVSVSADTGTARFAVRDQGIGIGKEHQARVFERFERAVPTENYAGMGLGLWIVNRIVNEMGGSIAVDSDEGQGATFTVTLPRAQPVAAPSPSAPAGASMDGAGALSMVAAGAGSPLPEVVS